MTNTITVLPTARASSHKHIAGQNNLGIVHGTLWILKGHPELPSGAARSHLSLTALKVHVVSQKRIRCCDEAAVMLTRAAYWKSAGRIMRER